MAIQPVTSVIFSNKSANNVNFEGKSKEKRSNSTIKSVAMAVPLATLVAMSPLSMSAAERNSVFGDENAKIEMVDNDTLSDQIKRSLSSTGKGVTATVVDKTNNSQYLVVIESQNKDGNYQKVFIRPPKKYVPKTWNTPKDDNKSEFKTVKEIRPTVLEITGDDGVCGMRVSFDRLMVEESGFGYSSEPLIEYIRDFAEGKFKDMVNDGAVKICEPYVRKACVGDAGNIKNGFRDTNWLDEGRNTPEPFGKCILSTNVKTRDGEYELMAFSPDGNDEDFENVVIRKKGEGMFKVAGLKYADINLMDKAPIGNFQLGIIELYKRNSKETAKIVDQELFETLWKVTKDTRFNNAFKTEMPSSNIVIYGKGELSTRD